MDCETNLNSIRALEKRIEEHERAIIQLKRTRNSLLNVSTLLPPEILGTIFRWNATPDGGFAGVSRGAYNFLLVCHHWFEVASRTPELWSFWGSSVHDWSHRHRRCGNGPLDLVLEGFAGRGLDDELRNALQDRSTRDTIRRIHLRTTSGELINAIITSLSRVTKGEEIRSIGVERFVVQNTGRPVVDVSTFFSQHRLPKLQCLRLSGCKISSWGLLKPQTTVLTTLELTDIDLSPAPTLSQMLSILSSSPQLQRLVLSYGLIPDIVDGDRPPSHAPLRHLKQFRFNGGSRYAFRLLSRLELPDKMDNLNMYLFECSPLDLSQTAGPYFGDFVRRRGIPGGGLGLSVDLGYRAFSIAAGDVCKGNDTAEVDWFADVSGAMRVGMKDSEAEGLCLSFIARIPREQGIDLQTSPPTIFSEDLCVETCDVTYLRLIGANLSTWFIEPDARGPHTFKELLRSPDHIEMIQPTLGRAGWGPLTDFLIHRAAVGNRISSLKLVDYPRMPPEVVESIKRAVTIFKGRDGDDD